MYIMYVYNVYYVCNYKKVIIYRAYRPNVSYIQYIHYIQLYINVMDKFTDWIFRLRMFLKS